MEVPGFLRLGALSPQYSSVPEDALPPVSDRAGLAMFSAPHVPIMGTDTRQRVPKLAETAMVASIGKIASPSQVVGYFEKDGYYTRDDPAHREASAWAGRGAEALGLAGLRLSRMHSGRSSRAGCREGASSGARTGTATPHHRPGRDVTLSAPKSVSLMALVGGDERIVGVHDRAVVRTLAWVERNAVETRTQDRAIMTMVRAGDQKMVAATSVRHDTSRNLDPPAP